MHCAIITLLVNIIVLQNFITENYVILNLKYESHWSQSITNTTTLYILEHTTTSFPTLLKKYHSKQTSILLAC